ncbi:hypothetical protein [Paucibacter sp. Y2R2-4]|uniref:hypothetical protein n=1 Tax=Paucibacter sp. Y2R2-4 TaxID=2893553 RepID=UPI0021E4A880|nr:hypothetical protein [Paucibacter sp. Y2R2-4]MCV2349336.1 hypothetical protein [Paucibacter sp. Y2R2-4]
MQKLFFTLLVGCHIAICLAAGEPECTHSNCEGERRALQAEARGQTYIQKQYWIRPEQERSLGAPGDSRHSVLDKSDPLSPGFKFLVEPRIALGTGRMFSVKEPLSFVVTAIVVDPRFGYAFEENRFLKVALSNGQIGFLAQDDFERKLERSRDENFLIDSNSHIYATDPAIKMREARAKAAKANANAAAKRKQYDDEKARERALLVAKPVPKIGMTPQEVLASQWGPPKDSIRTQTERQTSEVWIYSRGRIHFAQGRVTMIQD